MATQGVITDLEEEAGNQETVKQRKKAVMRKMES